MNQQLTHTQQAALKQEHRLAPGQLQSLDLLSAPQMELEARIAAEMDINPALERIETEERGENPDDIYAEYGDMGLSPMSTDTPEEFDANRDDFHESLDAVVSGGGDFTGSAGSETEEKRLYALNSIAAKELPLDNLPEQLRYAQCPENLRKAAESIIINLDERGYLGATLAEIALECERTEAEVSEALKIVQSFDPPGIAARDLRECLLLQIDREKGPFHRKLHELVEKHLDLIEKNKLQQIAKAMRIDMEDLQILLEKLKKLDPAPGAKQDETVYVQPEVTVVRGEDGEYTVLPCKDTLPKLRISPYYQDLLDAPDTAPETKVWLREKISAAQQLMRNLDMRTGTIQRIAELIVAGQHEFFENGPESLKPMTMREIAEKLNRDESTVSRAIANKYLASGQGLTAFRDFFSGGYRNDSGDSISSSGIKEIIRDAVEQENPRSPLSDSKIEKLLKDRGLTVARRTIAKYREELGIAPSHIRKSYT